VYDRPSKYDLEFFPATSEGWLWMCPACGYAQIGPDFADLKPRDAKRLKQFLEKEWQSNASTNIPFSTRLERTIRTNELLGRDKEFWKWFNRVLIYHYRTLDPEKARQYAKSEIRLLEEEMFPAKDTLYLLGDYHRMLGHSAVARDYFRRALKTSVNRPMEICLILISSILAAVMGFLWGRVRRKMIVKACVTLGTIALLVASFRLYEKLKESATPDEYYDQLIRDRMTMLSRKSDPTAERKEMSTTPDTGGK
jgi:Uncharacterized protein conserved in bacteria (DUF2225)